LCGYTVAASRSEGSINLAIVESDRAERAHPPAFHQPAQVWLHLHHQAPVGLGGLARSDRLLALTSAVSHVRQYGTVCTAVKRLPRAENLAAEACVMD
jgi:hypothetical protein